MNSHYNNVESTKNGELDLELNNDIDMVEDLTVAHSFEETPSNSAMVEGGGMNSQLTDPVKYSDLTQAFVKRMDGKKIAFILTTVFCLSGLAYSAFSKRSEPEAKVAHTNEDTSDIPLVERPDPGNMVSSEDAAYTFDPQAAASAAASAAATEIPTEQPIQMVMNTSREPEPVYSPPPPIEPPTILPPVAAAPTMEMPPPDVSTKADLVQSRLNSGPVLIEGQMGAGGASGDGETVTDSRQSDLARTLKATQLAKGFVKKIGNPDFVLTRGTFIRCTLDTKIVSDISGFASCTVNEPIYSFNGKNVLIKPGSRVSGEYSAPDTNLGQERMAVLWNRILTTDGFDVTLDSPSTDGMGANGMAGEVNNHWGKRLGAAMLISMIDGGLNILAASAQKSNTANVGITAGSQATKNMSEMVLEKTINKAPTITIKQGERINIYVARDIDFSGVMKLE